MKTKLLLFALVILLFPLSANSQVQLTLVRIVVDDTDPAESAKQKLAIELAKIYAFDQGARDYHLMKTYPNAFREMLPAIDSINFARFIDIVKEHGYPREEVLGEYMRFSEVYMAGVVMLLHNPKRLVLDTGIYELFWNEVREGRLSAVMFAEALDKYYVYYEGRSLYNSQFRTDPRLAVKGVSIRDKELSDSLRMDIGLAPLTEDEFIREE